MILSRVAARASSLVFKTLMDSRMMTFSSTLAVSSLFFFSWRISLESWSISSFNLASGVVVAVSILVLWWCSVGTIGLGV